MVTHIKIRARILWEGTEPRTFCLAIADPLTMNFVLSDEHFASTQEERNFTTIRQLPSSATTQQPNRQG